jgi:acetolactate synthase-1/2/3 large subunit
MTVKVSDVIAGFIHELGVRHVFMVPGGGAMHLNDSISHVDGVEVVYNLHEQASAIAAEAYARAGGSYGVAVVTSGPGGTNAVTGVLAAWLDSTPCIFFSGQVKRSDLKDGTDLRQLGPQEVDICSIVRPITKYAVTVTEPARIREHLEVAAALARSGRPGPVWIDVPLDVQAAQIDEAEVANPAGSPGLEIDETSILRGQMLEAAAADVATALAESERPVFLAGNGVRVSDGLEGFRRLVDRAQVPVLTTRLGVDLMPAADPLAFGVPGTLASRAANFTLQNSDFLLAIGARLDANLIAHDAANFARGAFKVVVNIDPAELARLRPTMGRTVCADASEFMEALARQLEAAETADRSTWIAQCRTWRTKYPFVTDESTHTARQQGAVSVYTFAQVMSEEADATDVILPGSSGSACEVFLTAYGVKDGQRVFHNKGTGAMGIGLPAAIGAALASGRRVICIDGDGGFQFNVQELQTVARLNVPIKLFVINNAGYASIRQSQRHHFGRVAGADSESNFTLPDIRRVASAYGLKTFRITRPGSARRVVRKALAWPGPCVCEVVVAADEERMPRVQSQVLADGSVVSKPLEDMWPYLDREEFAENMAPSRIPND